MQAALEQGERFDVILVDSTDPVDAAVELFSEGFYRCCAALLDGEGILAPQSDSPVFHMARVKRIYDTLGSIFGSVKPYLGHCVTYPGGLWAFIAASDMGSSPSREVMLERLQALQGTLRYLNLAIFDAAFALPEYVRRALAGEPGLQDPSPADTP